MQFAVTTTFDIEGYKIVEYKGIVRGIIVLAPTIAQGFLGGLKSIIGGNIGAYTEMCEQAREQAYELMIQHAQGVGANAVVTFDVPIQKSGLIPQPFIEQLRAIGRAMK